MKKSAPLSIRIRPDLKADLDRLAAADKRSVSSYVELVLEAHVERIKAEASAKHQRSR